ncbi:DUF4238 domain-containing protein [Xanthobacter wiegelii]|uniref:DUF4238 domain-containing protein n=1 Tax=Xanthobacter wiegelii TaxID=3119913 RepID=UPI00372B9EFA
MSGRKQHYIPQMLLRGFSSAGVGKKKQVFVYKRSQPPFSVSTEGIAAQREFYSPTSSAKGESLDDAITHYEQKILSPALTTMRSAPNGAIVERDIVSEAINHLTIRNAQVRNIAGDAMVRTLSNILDCISIPSEAQRLLGLAGVEVGPHIRKALETFWEDNKQALSLKGFDEDGFFKFASALVKDTFPQQHQNIISNITPVLSVLISSVPQITASSHIKALTQGIAPPVRTSKLAEFEWRVHDAPNLILSDCIAIARLGDDWLPLTLIGTDGVENIFVPINSMRAVIGSRHALNVPSDPRTALALSASEFFVAPGRSKELETLSSRIGSVTSDAIERMSTFHF